MSARRFDVVGIGANSVDYVGVVPAIPSTGAPLSKMRMRAHIVACGGQMATALATCARFGLHAAYVGAIGNDANGRLVRETLHELALDTSHVVVHESANQFALILIDERTGERVIFWDRDERLNLEDSELPADAVRSCRLLHVDDVDQRAAITAAAIARAHAIPVTSDIDRVTARTLELVGAVTVAIFAEHVPLELAARAGAAAADVAEALQSLPRRAGQILCATLGNRGAVALDDDGVHRHEGFRVVARDTTGAGDVFRGAFIYARLRGWSLDEQLRFANAAAAVSCTKLGALASVPSLEEVERLLTTGSI
jgi:sugar/nucleoside kinase (ribokinase family)